MLRKLMEAWRGKNTLALMLDQFDQMLAHDQWLFEQATDIYWRNREWPQVQDALYARDKQVNELERAIRREVVRHLTVHPGTDVVACLILMSVVKDAERIGDYCKNIYEIGKIFRHGYTAEHYVNQLRDIHDITNALFAEAREAFRSSNADLACQVQQTFGTMGKKCDYLVEQLLGQKDDMATDEAVAYGLLARHMKRIAAHLANIASSVVAPVESLDFMDETPMLPGDEAICPTPKPEGP